MEILLSIYFISNHVKSMKKWKEKTKNSNQSFNSWYKTLNLHDSSRNTNFVNSYVTSNINFRDLKYFTWIQERTRSLYFWAIIFGARTIKKRRRWLDLAPTSNYQKIYAIIYIFIKNIISEQKPKISVGLGFNGPLDIILGTGIRAKDIIRRLKLILMN